jgi:4-amino-4-deoxy-L-arabinose transferase-like glycosyltransferase
MKIQTSSTVILIALLCATACKSLIIFNKEVPGYDESISYLAATCNQANYSNAPFGLKPVPAAQWKQLLEVEYPFCFQQIQDGLASHDIHPPLFFWLLHIWFLIFGVTLWSGPFLNVVIFLISNWALYHLASHLFDDKRLVTLTLFSYALNPSVILISTETRQYELLGAFTILLAWQTIDFLEKPTLQNRIIVVLISIGGSLTHYYFILAIAACAAYSFIQEKELRKLICLVFLYFTGYLGAFFIHPFLFSTLTAIPDRVPVFSLVEMADRIQRVITSLSSFYYLLPLLLIIMLIIVIRKEKRIELKSAKSYSILIIPVLIGVVIILQYLSFRTPTHTMGKPKYWSMIWPFLAFLPAYTLQWFKMRRSVALYLYAVPTVLAILITIMALGQASTNPFPPDTKTVLLDHTDRGLVLPVIWTLPDNASLIVASQDELLQNQSWLDYVNKDSIYLGDASGNNTLEKIRKIQSMIIMNE